MRKQQVKSPMQRYSVKDFRKQFPNDDVCLEWLKNYLYPDGISCKKCQAITPHFKVASRRSYSCQKCGHHVHPTAGTIYHKSTTPLTDWFYAVFLMASTRCGISAKQLERELGCTYKTAWRMFKLIRTMLNESDSTTPLTGDVEVDETFIGGKSNRKVRLSSGKRNRFENKSIVIGAVQRNGSVVAKVIDTLTSENLLGFVHGQVEAGSVVHTDEARGYGRLRHQGYTHHRVKHKLGRYVGKNGTHTNTIEGFWSLLKNGIKGVYKHTSKQHLQDYVNEYAFRYNRRHDETPMFLSFLGQVRKQAD